MPYQVTEREGIVHLVLDTPGSAVNIFNQTTAKQVIDVVGGMKKGDARALVFHTAKPTSFINGVGLMLSHAASSLETVVRVSEPYRLAYLAVRNAPMPTIAAVQGTCWGCGVEFTLNCRYRIASDAFDTQFYMTDLADYLFIPLFRGTRNLPRTLGLDAAARVLLWGERWSAATAANAGLINETGPAGRFETAVSDFTERALRSDVADCLVPRHDAGAWGAGEDEAEARARARIAELPPTYQRVYSDCLELMVRALRGGDDEAQRVAEIERSTDSAVAAIGKAASAFFYIRQNASALGTGGARNTEGWGGVRFTGTGGALPAFTRALEARGVPRPPESTGGESVEVVDGGHATAARGARLYAPLGLAGTAFLELALPAAEMDRARPFVAMLERAGFRVGVSVATGALASDALLGAYLRPLASFVAGGGDPRVANAAMRGFGFTRRPCALVHALAPSSLARVVGSDLEQPARRLEDDASPSTEVDGHAEELVDAVCISLVAAARRSLVDGFPHPSVVDLAARELLDFPLQHRSLCSHLTRARVGGALGHVERIAPLVLPADRDAAARFVAEGPSFYL